MPPTPHWATAMRLLSISLMLLLCPLLLAQEKTKNRQPNSLPKPTEANYKYGPHERNVFDFWQAKSDTPTPLVIFIHGGGFVNGDKGSVNQKTLTSLLDAGISVAAINYRFVQQAPLPAAHDDCARALQTLRSKSKEWNIDKTRVGGYGGSAGAQLVMYLAFHDDLADPKNEDLIKRESTKLQCVAPNAGQASMDLNWWAKHIPHYTNTGNDVKRMFGTTSEEEVLKKNAEIAAILLIKKDSPPVFMTYNMAPDAAVPSDAAAVRNWIVHHVAHGMELKKRCDELGVEAHLTYPGAKAKYTSTAEFLKAKLTGK